VAAVIVVTLGFTFTRGAWLGGLTGVVVMAADKRARRVLAVIVLAVALYAPAVVFERALSSTNVGRMEISHRFDFWRGSSLVAEKRPLFGAGIGNYRYNYSRLPVPETALVPAQHPHNLALDLFADTGLVGLFAFGGLVATALLLLARRWGSDSDSDRRLWRLAIAAAMVGTLAHQTTDSLLLEPTWNAIMWVMLGLAAVAGTLVDAEVESANGAPVPAGTAVVASPGSAGTA
jgi:O-antigen ligase